VKRLIPKQNKLKPNCSIEHLHKNTLKWISEFQFIKVEEEFLKELLAEHIIEFCSEKHYSKAKLLFKGISHETILREELINDIKEHKINLALLLENIYLKKESVFRKTHEILKKEVYNYFENFKYIKQEIFELVLTILKNEKQKRLVINI